MGFLGFKNAEEKARDQYRADLLSRGTAASARVLDNKTVDGVRGHGDRYRVSDLVLEVLRPDGAPFRVEVRMELTFQEDLECGTGKTIPVRFDPSNGTTLVDLAAMAQKDLGDAELAAQKRAQLLAGAPHSTVLVPERRRVDLQARGTPARARVLDCTSVTGSGHGDRYEVRDLILDVMPPGGTPFRVGTRVPLTFAENMECWVNNEVPVRFDPHDGTTIFDSTAFAQKGLGEAELAAQKRAELLVGAPHSTVLVPEHRRVDLQARGTPARARVLDCLTVAGSGHGERYEVRDLILDVMPPGGTPFRVGTRVALTITENFECWVNNEVPVRFDPTDATTIFDSQAFAQKQLSDAELAEHKRAELLAGGKG